MKSSLKIVWKTNITFIKRNIAFLSWTNIYFIPETFFKIAKNLITSASFFTKASTKKDRYASAKASNAALVKLTDWIIKNDHAINCAMFFCKWFQHDQTSNINWLSTTWLLIFQLEVTNKRPLFTKKPASIWIQISC